MRRNIDIWKALNIFLIIWLFHLAKKSGEIKEKKVYLGIFTSTRDYENRAAQRETWLKTSKFKYRFLPDAWSKKLEHESEKFQDIIFLGNTTGRGGARLYNWLEYAISEFPKNSLIGITNSDFYACEDLYTTVQEYNRQRRMVFGWWHDRDPNWLDERFPNTKHRPNEQFVVITWELAAEILKWPYCLPSKDGAKCNIDSGKYRVDTTHAGSSLGGWLGDIGNITGIRMNDEMAHLTPFSKDRYPNPINEKFCKHFLSYHKSTAELMRHLHCHDELLEEKRICRKVETLKEFQIQF
ncbi:Oidioi.mRNA.OKI2018_I69.PAR.g8900.t1.cds [Oikopleura dioica]|uniref:Oidioi.mRNA.OKI2018_I69.PAR.g8900.t1.cds n=1 Tax=Oikopleura dioica TaxID=34765 RepID=A0ABN7RI35_OIKDI|nr:Oidioi.mRNA.OKI2018_I69.PAR.g8900.t1.cds [Oikopleura dioica]